LQPLRSLEMKGFQTLDTRFILHIGIYIHIFFSPGATTPIEGCTLQPSSPRLRGFLITYDAPQSVELLWTSDQSVVETST